MRAELNHSVDFFIGLGEIKFGITFKDVELILGHPNEMEDLDPEVGAPLIWSYSKEHLEIMFLKYPLTEVFFVDQIATSHPTATLWGEKLMGCSQNDVLSICHSRGYDDFEFAADTVGEQNYNTIRFARLRASFDFRGGLLRCILFGKI